MANIEAVSVEMEQKATPFRAEALTLDYNENLANENNEKIVTLVKKTNTELNQVIQRNGVKSYSSALKDRNDAEDQHTQSTRLLTYFNIRKGPLSDDQKNNISAGLKNLNIQPVKIQAALKATDATGEMINNLIKDYINEKQTELGNADANLKAATVLDRKKELILDSIRDIAVQTMFQKQKARFEMAKKLYCTEYAQRIIREDPKANEEPRSTRYQTLEPYLLSQLSGLKLYAHIDDNTKQFSKILEDNQGMIESYLNSDNTQISTFKPELDSSIQVNSLNDANNALMADPRIAAHVQGLLHNAENYFKKVNKSNLLVEYRRILIGELGKLGHNAQYEDVQKLQTPSVFFYGNHKDYANDWTWPDQEGAPSRDERIKANAFQKNAAIAPKVNNLFRASHKYLGDTPRGKYYNKYVAKELYNIANNDNKYKTDAEKIRAVDTILTPEEWLKIRNEMYAPVTNEAIELQYRGVTKVTAMPGNARIETSTPSEIRRAAIQIGKIQNLKSGDTYQIRHGDENYFIVATGPGRTVVYKSIPAVPKERDTESKDTRIALHSLKKTEDPTDFNP